MQTPAMTAQKLSVCDSNVFNVGLSWAFALPRQIDFLNFHTHVILLANNELMFNGRCLYTYSKFYTSHKHLCICKYKMIINTKLQQQKQLTK